MHRNQITNDDIRCYGRYHHRYQSVVKQTRLGLTSLRISLSHQMSGNVSKGDYLSSKVNVGDSMTIDHNERYSMSGVMNSNIFFE